MTTKISANEYNLINIILKLENFEECYTFFKDLCTPKELKDLSERFAVARFLYEGKYSYRKIGELTGVSLATIGRVARFLNQENYKGYKKVLDKIHNTNNSYKLQEEQGHIIKNFDEMLEDTDA